MGKILRPQGVKLFVGILFSVPELIEEVEQVLVRQFGAVDTRSDTHDFHYTDYYERQMGSPLWRRFLSFNDLISPAVLGGIKIQTNDLEARLASENHGVGRPVNLDPGYIELSKIVLATTKNFYHRIMIAEGIYGEVTMHYEGGEWRTFPWTFPDFRSGSYSDYFSRLRGIYKGQLGE
jgi:hypothetical protein